MAQDRVLVPFVDLKAQYASLREEMNARVLGVMESAYFVGGPVLEKFEREYAEWIGTNYCVGVANGTDAITLAARAAGLQAGDEALVPANSFFATAEAMTNAGVTPVFVDVDPVTCHMDAERAARTITAKTRAIVPVHLYGRALDMAPFVTLAQKHNLVSIEDCAQAHGAKMDGKRVGSSGRLTCYSFYPGKNLGAYGDGGAVTTSDEELAQRMRVLREHGSPVRYQHSVVGWNSRLDAMQAAVLSTKLPHLDGWNAARRAHAVRYTEELAGLPIGLPELPRDDEHVFHLFVIRCSMRDELKAHLESRGIQVGIHYPVPLHLTGAYQALGAPGAGSMPVTEQLSKDILSLPMYAELTDQQIRLVASAVREFVEARNPAPPASLLEARLTFSAN